MRLVKTFVVGWVLLFTAVMTLTAMNGSGPARTTTPSPRSAVTTHAVEASMLERDMQMLESMRASSSSSMNTMIAADRMWVDAEMIRLQEQYQAELDRMIGRP